MVLDTSTIVGEGYEEKRFIPEQDIKAFHNFIESVSEELRSDVYTAIVGLHLKFTQILEGNTVLQMQADQKNNEYALTMKVNFKDSPSIEEVSSTMHTLQTVYVNYLEEVNQEIREVLLNIQLEEEDSEQHHRSHFEENPSLHESFLMNLNGHRVQAVRILEELYEEILKHFDEENVKVEVNEQQKIQFCITEPLLPEELTSIGIDTKQTLERIQRAWNNQTDQCSHSHTRKVLKENVEILCKTA